MLYLYTNTLGAYNIIKGLLKAPHRLYNSHKVTSFFYNHVLYVPLVLVTIFLVARLAVAIRFVLLGINERISLN